MTLASSLRAWIGEMSMGSTMPAPLATSTFLSTAARAGPWGPPAPWLTESTSRGRAPGRQPTSPCKMSLTVGALDPAREAMILASMSMPTRLAFLMKLATTTKPKIKGVTLLTAVEAVPQRAATPFPTIRSTKWATMEFVLGVKR